MRLFVWLTGFCFFAVDVLPAQDDQPALRTVDLLIVAGQSNAVGYDADPGKLPADPADQQILFWWKCGDPPPDEHDSASSGEWTHLQPQPLGQPKRPRAGRQYGNFASASGGFGPEIGLARTLHARQESPLAVLKVAFSGTGMRTDWNPADAGDGGACYRALVSEYRRAALAARSDGIQLRPRALIWVQGESDANAGDAPKYSERLGEMIARLRADVATSDLIALIAVNTQFGRGQNASMPQIVQQQQQLAARDVHCRYVDTSRATIANAAHFDSAGTLEVGRLFASSLLQMEAAAR